METVFTNEMPVSKDEFDKFLFEKLKEEASDYVNQFSVLMKELDLLFEGKRSLYIKNKDFFLNLRSNIILPNLNIFYMKNAQDILSFDFKGYLANFAFLPGHKAKLPSLRQLRANRQLLINCDATSGCRFFVCVCDEEDEEHVAGQRVAYDAAMDSIVQSPEEGVYMFPVNELSIRDVQDLAEGYLIQYGLFPRELSDEASLRLEDLAMLENSGLAPELSELFAERFFKKEPGGQEEDSLIVEKLLHEVIRDVNNQVFYQLHWNLAGKVKEYHRTRRIEDHHMSRKEELLQSDKIRANTEAYEERILTDPNRGHWDLWRDSEDHGYTVELREKYVARNPLYDVKEDGVIAIDFGTKSTIVVYQSDVEHSLPMGIGEGNAGPASGSMRYENPTIMHFVDLDRFLKDYHTKYGRPNTRWSDLTISHTAQEQFAMSKSEEYYEYLDQIKKWAAQRDKQFCIRSHGGNILQLPPFRQLGEGDFDPVEIYAYYIGLSINNMRHGVFLEYYLSFPVAYEKDIRQKIVKSFERGLKKSLPESIVTNPEIMKKFHVNGEISEPVAYAVCALQEYGFAPVDGEEVFYGIFDFGGGTTDFDFGLWRQSAKRRYDYTIENFGAGGDEYLGGENLLEMLAFEVFKDNQALMREKNCSFALAPKCTEFLGSDTLLSDSQEAEKNMRNLAEILRPYWELSEDWHGEKEEKEEEDDRLELAVTLYDRDGRDYADEKLYFSRKKLNGLIEEKIREGIDNFFSALTLCYENCGSRKPETVNILLAGNSCKSPIVGRLFQEGIEKRKKDCFVEGGKELKFEIFPPLGTKDAYQKMKALGIPYREDDFEKPTGKTGVAFGLIQCREGGTIERISSVGIEKEIPFRYYIGWKSRKKFVVFEDESKPAKSKGKPDYHVWYKFIEADAPVFDLYYTTLPECVTGELMIEGNAAVKRYRCRIDVVDETAGVYIRAVNSHTIEYVVAKNDEVDFSKLGEIFRKELK